ncbi:MAG TPA: carboxypeptidase-like regulatory domain-containing protein [Gemmatimonadaceae bacterium]
MRHGRTALLILSATLARAPVALRAQATTVVVGVADAGNGAPLPNAQVRIPRLGRLGRADWLGEVRLRDVPRGRYTIEVRAMGYAASDITLEATGDSVGAVFLLQRAATPLDTVRVVADRVSFALPVFSEQFEIHRKMGIGRFLVDSQLQRLGTRDLSIALMTSLPGLKLKPGPGSQLTLVPTGVSGELDPISHVMKPCGLSVYLDGALYSNPEALNQLLPRDLAGIEYYDITEAPPQYRRGGALGASGTGPRPCKVLLLWSKY